MAIVTKKFLNEKTYDETDVAGIFEIMGNPTRIKIVTEGTDLMVGDGVVFMEGYLYEIEGLDYLGDKFDIIIDGPDKQYLWFIYDEQTNEHSWLVGDTEPVNDTGFKKSTKVYTWDGERDEYGELRQVGIYSGQDMISIKSGISGTEFISINQMDTIYQLEQIVGYKADGTPITAEVSFAEYETAEVEAGTVLQKLSGWEHENVRAYRQGETAVQLAGRVKKTNDNSAPVLSAIGYVRLRPAVKQAFVVPSIEVTGGKTTAAIVEIGTDGKITEITKPAIANNIRRYIDLSSIRYRIPKKQK